MCVTKLFLGVNFFFQFPLVKSYDIFTVDKFNLTKKIFLRITYQRLLLSQLVNAEVISSNNRKAVYSHHTYTLQGFVDAMPLYGNKV